MRYGQVWSFRGARVIRTETYADPAEARTAAGL
jgi:ketosteroid isomerase-like protein